MRWTIRIGTALALLWAVYAISPYFAAYRLVTAVQARDVEALKERVNFHAVRISLAQQILAVYFSATGEGNVSEAAARQLASVAAEVAEPLIAQLLSPEVLVDLLDDGWPQSVVSERAPQTPDEPAPEGRSETSPPSWPQSKDSRVGLGSPQLTWRDLLTMVDMRGFRRFLSDVSRGARGGFAHPSLLPLQAVVMAARRDRDPGRADAAAHGGVA